jgi:hypothetical protein
LGFTNVNVTLELTSSDHDPFAVAWNDWLKIRPNPNAPSFGEAIDDALSPDEADRFQTYLSPLMDDPSAAGRFRNANVYVSAVKPIS